MSEENKALDRRWFYEVWNQGNFSTYEELVSKNFVMHHVPAGQAGTYEGIKQAISVHRIGFPDLTIEVNDQLAEGDQVVSMWSITGTHLGEWVGYSPTGKTMSIQGMSLNRYQNAQIIESWLSVDMLTVMQQLGLVPEL
jgi:steroid delta-isomerase-like uncharacterized protein